MFLVSVTFSNFIQVGFGYVFGWLYDLTTNYALTIFLFALVVKLILLPASIKQKKATMKTARIAPQVKELERICGDDKMRYQQAVTELYKEEGVSMTGGCLWSLLPMLILFPLYYVIREPLTYVLRLDYVDILALKAGFGSSNAAYWQLAAAHSRNLMDLSMFGIDLSIIPSWHIWNATSWNDVGQFLIPLVSGGVNLLSMFVGQKLNASITTNEYGERDQEAANAAAQSGKTMMYLMPLTSVFFGFIMPAGMSVYWIAQGVLGILQEWALTVHYRKAYDAEDAERRERAAKRLAEEEEKERIRAQHRAENPDGITANTSRKKLEQKKAAEREAAARQYAAKHDSAADGEAPLSGDPERPYARGRAYQPDRYHTTSEE